MEIAKQYTKEEIEKHSQLLAITVNALEEREQDFLGEVFTFAELTNSKGGQFFTPYNVSYMCANMTIGEEAFPAYRICRINDCACGSGGMLVAAAQVMREKNYNYQQDALFIGQDIDARCVRMAFIQLSLLGVPAVIYCMDTICLKEYWHRETIGYYLFGMDHRVKAERLVDIAKSISANSLSEKEEVKEEEKQRVITMPSARELVQMELF